MKVCFKCDAFQRLELITDENKMLKFVSLKIIFIQIIHYKLIEVIDVDKQRRVLNSSSKKNFEAIDVHLASNSFLLKKHT